MYARHDTLALYIDRIDWCGSGLLLLKLHDVFFDVECVWFYEETATKRREVITPTVNSVGQ